MTTKLKKITVTAVIGLGILLCILGGYVVYVYASYYRIPDNQVLMVTGDADKVPQTGTTYTALSYNIGFGAYSQDFSFFMDGGKESVARSKSEVIKNIDGSIALVKKYNPDFVLLQEADVLATRSYKVNQSEMILSSFSAFDSTLAINYDSPFLAWPLMQPHGKSLAGIVTLSRFSIAQAERRSLPISTAFSKFFDLDRCYSVNAIPLANGKSVYVYNVHLSAYGGTPQIRAGQITMLFNDIAEKYAAGNYIICGGDFNHDLPGDSIKRLNKSTDNFDWAQPFPFEMLPAGIHFADKFIDKDAPTVRNCATGYVAGTTPIAIIDGFFVSDNIEIVRVENVQNDFLYSDHNPVLLEFKLRSEQ